VRDALLLTAKKMAMSDTGIWEKIYDKLVIKKTTANNKQLFDLLLDNKIMKLVDGEPAKSGKNVGKVQKIWVWGEGYDKDESGKEKRLVSYCGYEKKTPDECMGVILDRLDTQTAFKVAIEKVLKEAGLL
jgi:hypothetical protein